MYVCMFMHIRMDCLCSSTSLANCLLLSISGGDLGEDMGMDIDVGRIKGRYITKKGFFSLHLYVCLYVCMQVYVCMYHILL